MVSLPAPPRTLPVWLVSESDDAVIVTAWIKLRSRETVEEDGVGTTAAVDADVSRCGCGLWAWMQSPAALVLVAASPTLSP